MEPRLWEAFREGKRAALERVYWDHIDQVETLVRVGLLRAGQFSAANVADVVQEVFAKAFAAKSRAAYDGVREYTPFLRQIARNALVDWLRVQRREGFPTLELDDLVDGLPTEHEDPRSLFDPELLSVVQRFVQELEPPLRAVHDRRFLAAESQHQVAIALGISRQNVRTLERRLLTSLRREIRNVQRDNGSLIFFQPSVPPKPY
jgi:RNA polymerase sigma factor (sigma-70 family)